MILQRRYVSENEHGYILTLQGRQIPLTFEEGQELMCEVCPECGNKNIACSICTGKVTQ